MISTRIIIAGKAASGKDFLRQRFEARGFKYAVSYTTRPPRPGETHGIDYFFISESNANKMIELNLFYEWVEFNGWIYGTTHQQFYQDDLFIMTPTGIGRLLKEDRATSFIIFLDIDESVRRERLLAREMPGDSIERRLQADRLDFLNFTDFDLQIKK